MGIEEGTQVEVVLENSIEKDLLTGTFDGWTQYDGLSYLVLVREDGYRSYICQDIIKVIHTYGGEHG